MSSDIARDFTRERRFTACTSKVWYIFRYTKVPADCIDQEKPHDQCCESCRDYLRQRGRLRGDQ